MFYSLEKIEKQTRQIGELMVCEMQPISAFKMIEQDIFGAERLDFDDRGWQDFSTGSTWGGYDKTAWFRTRVSIPAGWRGEYLALRFLIGPRDSGGSTAESLLYVDGVRLQAIDVWHEFAWLPPEFAQKAEILVSIKAWSGVLNVPECRHFKLAQLMRLDEPTRAFYYLSNALLKAIKLMPVDDLNRIHLLSVLNQSFGAVDFLVPGSEAFYNSVAQALNQLQAGVEALKQPGVLKPTITCIGHAHIDMAWLWRLQHTRQKAIRTFSTVLHLMRQYPEYRFMHSSPQLYAFVKQDDPQLYQEVKAHIASGQWEITGGMWVEPDTNLTSGESLIRQILYGQRFMREEFGVTSSVVWLPDVFGFSGALPQIIKKSGLKYLLTSKISWSQFNRFPHDTFKWRGVDGSEVLAYFVTTPEPGVPFSTYGGELNPAGLLGEWQNYRQKEINDELLHLYGWGDGGGGPTVEMLENSRVLSDLPSFPAVRQGKSEDFFARLEQRLQGQPVPVWDGELYLEYHRGTYTSQAANKKANRRAEQLYHNAEWVNTLDNIVNGGTQYPAAELEEGWKMILLNQFHDILPGSSIAPVYVDSQAQYQQISAIGQRAFEQAANRLVGAIRTEQNSLLVLNSMSWARQGVISLPCRTEQPETVLAANGQPALAQVVEQDGINQTLIEVTDIPALGWRAFPLVPETQAPHGNELQVSSTHLSNRFFDIQLNDRGQIMGMLDKTNQRQILPAGSRANVLQAFEDKPMNFDAWDIDLYYQEKMREVDQLVDCRVVESGPVRAALRLTWQFNASTITQWITLYRSLPRIDFRTEVDWHEHQTLLKAAFPVQIRSTRATYDIQFGTIERATHWNTSWDMARFEMVGQKWADLSEGGYGVSLLNDCKYGHDIKENVMRLTLIKSGIDPDPMADQGQHSFTYSLFPHCADWRSGGTVEQAYDLNYPLQTVCMAANPSGTLESALQLAQAEPQGVIIETLKRTEDGDGWVVRVYESRQERHSAAQIKFARSLRKAVECNLVEENPQPVDFTGDTLTFSLAPFEIKTFIVWF